MMLSLIISWPCCRCLHSCYRAVHWFRYPSWSSIHRNSIRVLHGGECSDLPTVCGRRDDEPMADPVLLALLLTHLCHVHPPVALCTCRQAKRVHAWSMCCCCNRSSAGVCFHGPWGPEARVLGGTVDAMDSFHIHLSQRILVGRSAERVVLSPVWILLRPHYACICSVQRSFELWCRGRRKPFGKHQGICRQGSPYCIEVVVLVICSLKKTCVFACCIGIRPPQMYIYYPCNF